MFLISAATGRQGAPPALINMQSWQESLQGTSSPSQGKAESQSLRGEGALIRASCCTKLYGFQDRAPSTCDCTSSPGSD